jgi:hypothetical protein
MTPEADQRCILEVDMPGRERVLGCPVRFHTSPQRGLSLGEHAHIQRHIQVFPRDVHTQKQGKLKGLLRKVTSALTHGRRAEIHRGSFMERANLVGCCPRGISRGHAARTLTQMITDGIGSKSGQFGSCCLELVRRRIGSGDTSESQAPLVRLPIARLNRGVREPCD